MRFPARRICLLGLVLLGAFPVLAASAQADATADYRAAVLADAPLAYWPFDETSGSSAADIGSAGATGVYAGAATLGAQPPFGAPQNRAVRLGATGTMSAQVPGTGKAVELWVRPSQRVAQTFVRFGDAATATGWSLGLAGAATTGSQRRRLVFTAAGKTTNSKITLQVGAWSLVNVNWGPGNKIRFSVNGGTRSKSPAPGALPAATAELQPLVIGPGAGSGGTTIDEVALYTARPDESQHYLPSGLPVLQSAPLLSPLAAVRAGQTLTLTPGIWNAGTSVTDQWQRCDVVGACQAIAGVSGATYVVQPIDAGFTIQVQESGTNASGSVSVYTDASDAVAMSDGAPAPSPPVLPPGTDPAVPDDESAAAIDAGGQITDPAGGTEPGPAGLGTPSSGGTPDSLVPPPPSSPPAPLAAATAFGSPADQLPEGASAPRAAPSPGPGCSARLMPARPRRARVPGGRITISLSTRARTVTVKGRKRALRRLSWTLDGHRVRAVTRRSTKVRLPAMRSGVHRLTGKPRSGGKRRAITLRLTVRCR